MSYDITLTAELGGSEPYKVYELNYTSNIRPMLNAASFHFSDLNGKEAGSCIRILEPVVKTLMDNPKKFEVLNPTNGWGDYHSIVRELRNLLEACRKAPLCQVNVSW